MMRSMDVGVPVDVLHSVFNEVFDTVSHRILIQVGMLCLDVFIQLDG